MLSSVPEEAFCRAVSHPLKSRNILHKHRQLQKHIWSSAGALSAPPGAVWGAHDPKVILPLVSSTPGTLPRSPRDRPRSSKPPSSRKFPRARDFQAENQTDWLRQASHRYQLSTLKGQGSSSSRLARVYQPLLPPCHRAGCGPRSRSPLQPSADVSPGTLTPAKGRRGDMREKQPPTWVPLSLPTRMRMVREFSWGR